MSITIASVFQDNMVLQCDRPVPIWGRAAPGEAVTVSFAGRSMTARADTHGRWRVTLAPLTASAEPSAMTITGDRELTLRNVLVGEVWVASGQSNMQFALKHASGGPGEMARADDPQIRLVALKPRWSKDPSESLSGAWQTCRPETAGDWSAVAYFFAREIRRRLDVPVGIVQSAWGGTPAEAWTPIETLRAEPARYAAHLALHDKYLPFSQETIGQMRFDAERAERHQDTGNAGESLGWARPDADLADWRDVQVPGYLEEVFGNVDGAFWFRRDIELPPSWAHSELTLRLGAVDDLDTTYFNGVKIGATGFEVPEWWEFQREYRIPPALVKAGRNTLAVRVFDERNAGGLSGPLISLLKAGAPPVNLAGVWKLRAERILAPLPPAVFQHLPHIPAFLYNGMIAPLVPFAMRGVIWYQGENNVSRAVEYRTLFQDMIRAWRGKWGHGDFPFYFVQLASYHARQDQPGESDWAALREAQNMALTLPNTGMAVAIDIGHPTDIHPSNKWDVGLRLALNALAGTYGRPVEYSGPTFKSMTVERGRIRLKFEHAAGLKARGDTLTGFTVCGADRRFVRAQAIMEGGEVVVWNDAVQNPLAARYAWADNPDCNLYNGAGLPAAPFRTDAFPVGDHP